MPSFSIDISDKYLNLFNSFVDEASNSGNLNPGQIVSLNNIKPDISAIATVNIEGTKISINLDIQFEFTRPDYLSEIGDLLLQTVDMFSDQIIKFRGTDSEELVDQAFASL